MNKREMKGLPTNKRNVGLLKGRKPGSRILILGDQRLNVPAGIRLEDFFDVIVVTTAGHSDYMPEPDCFIYASETINGEFDPDLGTLFELKSTLLVVSNIAVEKMRAIKIRPQAYMVMTALDVGGASAGEELAILFGAAPSDIWYGHLDQLQSLTREIRNANNFFQAVDKYRVPANIKKVGRRLLMEEWS